MVSVGARQATKSVFGLQFEEVTDPFSTGIGVMPCAILLNNSQNADLKIFWCPV